jgi:hypothetical protein
MKNDIVSNATRAMAECISLTLASDDDGETKAKSLAESFQQMQDYLTKNAAGDDGETANDHPAIQIADLLVEAGRFPNRAAAIDHLLHSSDGATTLRRHSMSKQESPMPDTIEKLEAARIANLRKMADGAVEISKAIVAKEENIVSMTEEEFTGLVTAFARKQHPNDRADVAFSKVFSENETIRRAYAIVKALPPTMSLEPTVVSGPTTFQDSLQDRSEAYENLVRLAEKMRASSPELTPAKAFERTLADPRNRALAERALQHPLPPSGGFPFPFQSSPGRQ